MTTKKKSKVKKNYKKLCQIQKKISRLSHARSILTWDHATIMSHKGSKERLESISELSKQIYKLSTKKKLRKIIIAADDESLNKLERRNLHLIKFDWQRRELLPKNLLVKKQNAQMKCEYEWRKQKKENNWKDFEKNLDVVINFCREEANILSDKLQKLPYDNLLQKFDSSLSVKKLDSVFGQMKVWLPEMIQKTQKKQENFKILPLGEDFDTAKQKNLCIKIMKLLGFDFSAGRLDSSEHPFCGGVRTDIRLTTRFNNNNFLNSLFGIIHETGHAKYEQNLPSKYASQPIGQSASMSIHESQSLFLEKKIGCSHAFIKRMVPMIKEVFGNKESLSHVNLYNIINHVQPSFIRVEADEITYHAHILLRYEIEKELINNRLKTCHLPEIWDEKLQENLGISSNNNYGNGVMQDIHWTQGLFGYFPCYSIGAMYAAQFHYFIEKKFSALDTMILEGNFKRIFDWLKKHIWENANIYESDELARLACGGDSLNQKYLEMYLTKKYLGLVNF